MAMKDMLTDSKYRIKQKVLTVGGLKYWIYDSRGSMVGFCHKKILKLKDEMVIYADEKKQKPLLVIKQENILNAKAIFSIVDAQTGEHLGYFGRKYLKSILKDTWKIYNVNKQEVGEVVEDTTRAILRRLLTKMIPKEYYVKIGGQTVARYKQKFKIIGDEWWLDFTPDTGKKLDKRLGIAGAIIMATVERFQGH